MGLDVSHDAFRGAYFAFNRLRQAVAKASGGSYPPHPPEYLAADPKRNADWWYYDDEVVPPEHIIGARLFLGHSDCSGTLDPEECVAVAGYLRWAAPRIDGTPGDGHLKWAASGLGEVALKFAQGCETAAEAGESLEFC